MVTNCQSEMAQSVKVYPSGTQVLRVPSPQGPGLECGYVGARARRASDRPPALALTAPCLPARGPGLCHPAGPGAQGTRTNWTTAFRIADAQFALGVAGYVPQSPSCKQSYTQPPLEPPTRGLRQRAGLSIPAAKSRTPSSCTDGAPLGPNTYKLGTKVIRPPIIQYLML